MIGQKRKNTRRGFTFIEILVVIFITALLSTLILVNYRSGQQRYAVNSAAQKMAADLRRAQNLALSGTLMPSGCTIGTDCSTGFGIHVDSTSQYKIFYNKPGMPGGWQYKYRSNPPVPSVDLPGGTVSLPSGVTVNTGNDVFFTPPDPTTYINGDNFGSRTFTLTAGSNTRTVIVNSSGRIDIQ